MKAIAVLPGQDEVRLGRIVGLGQNVREPRLDFFGRGDPVGPGRVGEQAVLDP